MPNPFVLPAVIGGLGSVLSGFFGASSQESANETNILLNRENRDWQEKMWNLNNEYNTPANQIQRLMDAGLNPNLMYGQGTVGNSSSPAHPVSTPHVQPVNFMQGLAGSMDAIVKMQQAKLLEAQAKKIEGTTLDQDTYKAGFVARTDYQKQLINQSEQLVYLMSKQAELVDQNIQYYGADKSAQWNYMEATIEQNWKRLYNQAVQLGIEQFKAETGRMVSRAQIEMLYKQAQLLAEKVIGQRLENSITDQSQAGRVLKILQDGINSYLTGRIIENKGDTFMPQLIFDDIIKALNAGANVTDAIVPF